MNIPTRLSWLLRLGLVLMVSGGFTSCELNQHGGITRSPQSEVPYVLTQEEFSTLASLEKVDDYPLYTMIYYGDYPSITAQRKQEIAIEDAVTIDGGCSLFTTSADQNQILFGRNFDWQFSPALLLFMHPTDGYASVSMVDIAYFGFDSKTVGSILEMPVEERKSLLDVPSLPFDGMNEEGLVIGMAAVPGGELKHDPAKPAISDIGIIREILDHASDVEEAIDLIRSYHIIQGSTPIHYLIADAHGRSVVVEFWQGEMQLIPSEENWQVATNFLISSEEDLAHGCWRFDLLTDRMNQTNGQLGSSGAMELLEEVSQENTQWSVVYDVSGKKVTVVLGNEYGEIHLFELFNP